ncbi:phasin family protein [Methylocapsa palsarum]|uniref:Phasin protein n=1 Tax=Methylocapsa palsarum TaxID=1612308 RepID=A0A1I3Z8Y0_9HYPH|nr:phasin family protein [Methylocapsa palsarum]SFK40161.1 Phasin protein [Methylocapsa palsarum]
MANNRDDFKISDREELERATASASSFVQSASSFVQNIHTIALETASYAKTAFEDGAAYFEKLGQAKSFESALQLQADYARASCEAFVTQAARVAELYARLGEEARKPFETILAKAGSGKT